MTTKEDDDRSIRVSNTACSGEFELLDFSCSDDSDEQTEVEISETLNGVNSFDERKEDERAIFQKARQYLNPGCFFRSIVYFYAERKIIVFFWIHFVCTLVIWAHFALIKFNEQAGNVPEGANRYWLKRLAPPLEFGSMHAILFQLALLPVTMSRFSIAALSESIINKIVPLNRALRMHIHLGYTMIIIVFLATVFFFAFFGILCADGEQAFCDKFTSEIMITGYTILGSLLIIGGTSFFRHKIPYEVFYGIHHLVFVMYFVTIAHTLDKEQRSGAKERSQTFQWFSSTLLFYFCDRAAMYLNHRYDSRLLASSVVRGTNGSKLVILKISRPVLFDFKPGQYAFLRINEIDRHWHPFSIASYPDSGQLEFYIEVYEGKTWTTRLWDILVENDGSGAFSNFELRVEVMGPYGTSLVKTDNYSHVLAVGAGTGIVPILSLYKQHVRNLLRLDPVKYFSDLREREKKARQIENARNPRKGSFAKNIVSCCHHSSEQLYRNGREELEISFRRSIARHDDLKGCNQLRVNMKEMKKAVSRATRSIYGIVFLTGLPVIGVSLFALTVSWNTMPMDIYPGMADILKVFTMIFQALFAIVALFVWNGNNILAYVDVVICLINPFADWYWLKVCEEYVTLRPIDIVTYSLIVLYMTSRLWTKAVTPRKSGFHQSVNRGAVYKMDRFDFVWTTKSASQVSDVIPDILALWNILVDMWGLEDAQNACRISIYVTDKDMEACSMLQREVRNTDLYKSGGIQFQRADLLKVIEDHSIDLICTRRNSQSLLAFCGSPALAREIHRHKISNDMIVAITGNKNHQMDFVSESYGGVKSSNKDKMDETDSEAEGMQPLTTRKNTVYSNRRGLRDLQATKFYSGSKGYSF